MTSTAVSVGLGDIQVFKGPASYTCVGLGSCVGIAALDPETQVSGLAHIMLPESFGGDGDRPGKFADHALPALLDMMGQLGAEPSRVRVAVVGGAQMFSLGDSPPARLDMGSRNVRAVQEMIERLGLRCAGEEVGGNLGRTLIMNAETGEVQVRTILGDKPLCNLRD